MPLGNGCRNSKLCDSGEASGWLKREPQANKDERRSHKTSEPTLAIKIIISMTDNRDYSVFIIHDKLEFSTTYPLSQDSYPT